MDLFARGMRYLRRAALFQLLSVALLVAAAAMAFPALLAALSALRPPRWSLPDLDVPARLLTPLALPVLTALASLLLGAVSVYVFLVPSASSFARWSASFSSSCKMLKLGYWGALLLGILSAALVGLGFRAILRREGIVALAWLLGGAAASLITLLLLIVGAIGIVTLLLKLYEATGMGGFKTAAMLIALQIVLGLLGLIPFISVPASLAIVALHIVAWYLIMDSASRATLPPPPPPTSGS